MKKFIGLILLVGLLFGCEKSVLITDRVNDTDAPLKSTTNLSVPDDYTTIQEAVNAAEDGTTITVKEGIYTELIFIAGKSNLTLIGENAMIRPPEGAIDPNMNIEIYESSNIKILNLEFDGKNVIGEYPVYCAIGFTSSSGEASHNKIEGYALGIACFNTNEAAGVPGEDLEVKFSNNTISQVTGNGINLIGNFNVEIEHNLIRCSEKYFDNWWWFIGINMEGGTGNISKNNIMFKKNAFKPITTVGIRLMMRNPADHNACMMNDLHDVVVAQNIIKDSDVGIMVNSYDPLPEPEVWCVHNVSLLKNTFIKVGLKYDINNECEEIEIK